MSIVKIVSIMTIAFVAATSTQVSAKPPAFKVVVDNENNDPVPVKIKNKAKVVITNTDENPVPVTTSDGLFVFERTVAFSQGEDFTSRVLFQVPTGKTLLIEYISAFNSAGSSSVGPNGQETSFSINYAASGTDLGDFPSANMMFESKSEGLSDMGGAKVFLPVPADMEVKASIRTKEPAPF